MTNTQKNKPRFTIITSTVIDQSGARASDKVFGSGATKTYHDERNQTYRGKHSYASSYAQTRLLLRTFNSVAIIISLTREGMYY